MKGHNSDNRMSMGLESQPRGFSARYACLSCHIDFNVPVPDVNCFGPGKQTSHARAWIVRLGGSTDLPDYAFVL